MVRSLFYVLILLLLYFIIQFIFFPTPPKLLAKQICIAPVVLVQRELEFSMF